MTPCTKKFRKEHTENRFSMDQQTVRINKALADAGVCSRRGADALVAAGAVKVNGETVTSPGLQIRPGMDIIEVHGKPIRTASRTPCYLMLHKPVRVVSTVRDPQGRTTLLDLLPAKWKERRLYPAGRLDYFSEGLVLLTDDGELTNRLIHPRHHLPRIYHVLVRGSVPEQALHVMRSGMTLAEGEKLAPVEVRVLPGARHDLSGLGKRGQAGTLLEMTLHQGLNRQIRRMCRDLGLTVLRLVRVAQGPLRLGVLPAGEVRELTPAEIAALRRASGLD